MDSNRFINMQNEDQKHHSEKPSTYKANQIQDEDEERLLEVPVEASNVIEQELSSQVLDSDAE